MVNFQIGDSQIKELATELKLTMTVKNLMSKHKDAIHRIALSIAKEKTRKIAEELANQIMIKAGF